MLPPILLNRLNKELGDLERDPPPGIMCFPVDDDITHLEAYIKGPPDSPYEKGTFRLEIHVPHDYPFNPPQIRFKTMIYHPNIDDAGRICADILKKGEHGGWKPALNLSTTLISLSALMGSPNPDDPLDAEIAQEYRVDNSRFLSKARELTLKYATGEQTKKDTTLQKQESKSDSSSAEAVDDLERNANHPKQKSKLKLSTKKRKSKSPSVLDSGSTPSNSQMPGEDICTLEVRSNEPPDNAESTICDNDKSVALKVESDVPSSNADSTTYDDSKAVNSDTPSASAEHLHGDNFPVGDTEALGLNIFTSSGNTGDIACKDKPVEVMEILDIDSSVSFSNESNAVCSNIEPIEVKDPAMLPGIRANSPVQHPSSQRPGLSESSSQKSNVRRSTSTKSIETVDSMLIGKENLDDTVGSQTSVQSIGKKHFPPLKLVDYVDGKEMVKKVKKDKGKAVHKPQLVQTQNPHNACGGTSSSPSEYTVGCGWRSSFDSFSFENAIDLTSDNDYIPKKRTIDLNKRNKLSLSKNKRQKSLNNASQS